MSHVFQGEGFTATRGIEPGFKEGFLHLGTPQTDACCPGQGVQEGLAPHLKDAPHHRKEKRFILDSNGRPGQDLEANQGGIHLWRGEKGVARNRKDDPGPGGILHEDGEGAIVFGARPGGQSQGHLFLYQKRPPPEAMAKLKETLQEGAGDIIREIGHHLHRLVAEMVGQE